MAKYIVQRVREYYDMDSCDARGYPRKYVEEIGEPYETNVEPHGEYKGEIYDGVSLYYVKE